MIIGTAGHIDHGKTTLVRALTGVDTDRLPEEKARGISIDLGYAYAPLAGGGVLGFVDVPGHEKFVHTMLAGATGIDFALLVVAADDGVMPQTREHLDILALLGVARGAIALTKIDAVDAARVAEVRAELQALVANTGLGDAPIHAVSARTGEGIDALRAELERESGRFARGADDRHFRLAVDRSFTLPGIGTVVTGTVHAGEIRVGSDVVVAPSGHAVRVRSIHAQNRASDRGTTGERCALNLVGIARDAVGRGDWIVAAPVVLSTARFDATLVTLPGAAGALGGEAHVHIHLGAAHALARLVPLDSATNKHHAEREYASRLVQVVLQDPIAAWRGDRFIVRDASATRTIGGGTVLDPLAPARYRKSPERLAILAALAEPTPRARVIRLLETSANGVDLARFARSDGVLDLDALVASIAGVRRVKSAAADILISDLAWQILGDRALDALAAFHVARPDELGPDAARLKRIAFAKLDAGLFRALATGLLADGRIRQGGPWLHLPGHSDAPTTQEQALVDRMLARLLDAPFDPPWVRDLAGDLRKPEALVRASLVRAAKRGECFQVVRDLFFHPIAIRELATTASALQDANGEVRAAAFRDSTSMGRKRAIQVLEFFDHIGVTRRVGDRHIVRADNALHT